MRTHVRNLLTLAALTAVALSFTVFLLDQAGVLPSFGDHRKVRAVVSSAVSLTPGAGVKVAGLDAGRVDSIERRGTATVVAFTLDDDAPLPQDSKVAIRLRSLIGENYLEVLPGDARQMLADDGTIPEDQTSQYVEVEQILDQVKGPTRDRARALIQGLGNAVQDRGGALNKTLAGVNSVVREGEPVTQVLAKERRPVARLVQQFAELGQTVGSRGAQLKDVATQARTTFQAIAERDAAVGRTLKALPPTMTQVRTTSGVLRRTSAQASPVLDDLGKAITELDPSFAALRPAAQQGREAVRELGVAAPQVQTTLSRIRALSVPFSRATPELKRTMCQINPAVAFVAPYAQELANLFGNTGSVTNFYDATGHSGRLQALVSDASFGGNTPETSAAAKLLLTSGLVGEANNGGYNPEPAPGGARDVTKGRGRIGPADVKEPFHRVEAEC